MNKSSAYNCSSRRTSKVERLVEEEEEGDGTWRTSKPPIEVDTNLVAINKNLSLSKRRKRLAKTLIVIIMSFEILANHFNDKNNNNNEDNQRKTNRYLVPKFYGSSSLIRSVLNVIVLVAATNEVYAEESADNPAVDALEEDDEDDDELNASASNDYPDGENDNDESYEDADDDRQESRITEQWIKPAGSGITGAD